MNEFDNNSAEQKNNVLPDNADSENINSESDISPDTVNENTGELPENDEETAKNASSDELEKLRDMFQEELDKATGTYLAGGDLQECEETSEGEAETEEKAELLHPCECCGENEADISLGDDYPYCSKCRDIMKHYPLGAKGILSFILVIAFIFSALSVCILKNSDVLSKSLEAENYFSQKKLYSAMAIYGQDILGSISTDNVPTKIVSKIASAYFTLGSPSYSVQLAEQYIPDFEKKMSINSYLEDCEKQNSVSEKVAQKLQTLDSAMEADKQIEEITSYLDELKKDEYYADSLDYLEYYKYLAMRYFGATQKEQYDFLCKVHENYPDYWIVDIDLCYLASRMGDEEKAVELQKAVCAHNSEEVTVYTYCADAVRFSKNPDTQKMLDYAQKGKEAMSSADMMSYMEADIYRIQTLAYLLDGDLENAFSAAKEMFNILYQNQSYYYSYNYFSAALPFLYTYAICANECGESEEYDSTVTILNNYGVPLPDELTSYVEGDISLKEILTNSEGIWS